MNEVNSVIKWFNDDKAMCRYSSTNTKKIVWGFLIKF